MNNAFANLYILNRKGAVHSSETNAKQALLRIDNATAYDSRLKRTPGMSNINNGNVRSVATKRGRCLCKLWNPAPIKLEIAAIDTEHGARISWESRLTVFGIATLAGPLAAGILFVTDFAMRSIHIGVLDFKAAAEVALIAALCIVMYAIIRWMVVGQRDFLIGFIERLFSA